ncbi:MAG: RNA polymerase sigma factor RpoH [Betaproteobacteria bacterium]|nr:RNA polymerase sigma factor RpoH [Betaproteobacteria bacterium]MBI3056251.1 RNA polymerase sigma factor RpoH [Betaproteobacteria bacterium]
MTSYALPIPTATGSLEGYIQTVKSFPILSQQEETDFARRFRQDGDLDAARQLIVSHLRVVVAIARGYMGYGLPQADLIQEGNIGLMKAVKRFDPERGVRLVSFAVHWIRAEMHEFILRNWRIVKIATTKAQRKLFFNLRSMKPGLNTLGGEEVKAIARQLGVNPEEVIEMETRLGGKDIALEPLGGEEDDEGYAPIAYLTDSDAEPGRILEHEQTARLKGEGLQQALASLDARSRRIIESRWLREADQATLHDLAAEFGVSAERIRQIEHKAMQKMRGVIGVTAA